MDLIHFNPRTETITAKLQDGRIGKVYKSGYVRVSVINGNSSLTTMIYSETPAKKDARLYQINKVVKTLKKTAWGPNYNYARVMEDSMTAGLHLLTKFEKNNCSPEAVDKRKKAFCKVVYELALRKNNIY